MRSKIRWVILTFILILGIYFGLKLAFGIFTPYNYFTANRDIQNGKIQIIELGEVYMPQIEMKLASKYGFEINFPGCIVTKELKNGTDYYNAEVIKYLNLKNGKNFWNNLKIERDSLINISR